MSTLSLGSVAAVSLEPWDDVFRRNQHFATRLIGSGAATHLTFVEPVRGGLSPRAGRRTVGDAIEVLTPPQIVPRRYGGARVTGRWLRHELATCDVLWINDPTLGASALRRGQPAVYDVTDDWRSMPQSAADRGRIVAAEDTLARSTRTVVCSDVLSERWRQRYGLAPAVVRNGVDLLAITTARSAAVEGPGPHAVYVGTLHGNRVDVALCLRLAEAWPGTVHLVGPDHLDADARASLDARGVRREGPVAASAVPGWLAVADVLICPHLVDEFTLSLDAIKSHEYLATSKPVVATASSGFQALQAPGLQVADGDGFVTAALSAISSVPLRRNIAVDWDERTREFADQLAAARSDR